MAKSLYKGIPTHAGLADVAGSEAGMMVHPSQLQDGYFPGTLSALGRETITLLDINYIGLYNTDWYTETKDGS